MTYKIISNKGKCDDYIKFSMENNNRDAIYKGGYRPIRETSLFPNARKNDIKPNKSKPNEHRCLKFMYCGVCEIRWCDICRACKCDNDVCENCRVFGHVKNCINCNKPICFNCRFYEKKYLIKGRRHLCGDCFSGSEKKHYNDFRECPTLNGIFSLCNHRCPECYNVFADPSPDIKKMLMATLLCLRKRLPKPIQLIICSLMAVYEPWNGSNFVSH